MGVKGLTSFIAKNAEQYMKPYQLHDCDLVIDGDNIACNLYKEVSQCNSAFGGDYDQFYRTVIKFFQLMSKCRIRCFVLLDGGYEKKKMRTVQIRLRSKIGHIKHIDPSNSKTMFPLLMREVFVDALKDSKVYYMRCMFEADEELAALARCLNCPVLSYDSDFYVFNVKYIPLITLDMKVSEKSALKMKEREQLRLCEARKLKKKKQINSGHTIKIDDTNNLKKVKGKTIKFLDCCLYKIENLLEKGKLDKEKLPLFATLLGNDYINVKIFNNFYSQVSMRGVSKKIPKHQKRVMVILKWLRHETKQSALEKILNHVKKYQREFLLRQVEAASCGYLNELCFAFNYFHLTDNDRVSSISDSESENSVEDSDVEDFENNYINESEEDSKLDDNLEFLDCPISDEVSECLEENSSSESEKNLECTVSNSEDEADDNVVHIYTIPEHIQNSIYSASFPRFVNDLLHLKLFINNPQVENFLSPDCTETAIPILLKNFLYLHYPEKPELKYLTRVTRLTNCIFKKIPTTDLSFDKDQMLEDLMKSAKINLNNLLCDLEQFHSDIRYYLLCIIWWSKKSKFCNEFHIHALLICLIALRYIDSKVEPIRKEKEFHRTHGKKIQKEKQVRNNLSSDSLSNSKNKEAKEILMKLPITERINCIPKTEILLLQENLLKYFSYRDDNRNSHTIFSSTIIHAFSEFQSVIYQMYTLNVLLNYKFDQIKMSNLYCGLFLYNVYKNLETRIDIQYFIKNYIFQDSETAYEFYQTLGNFCEKYVPLFKMVKPIQEIKIINMKKKLKKKAKKLMANEKVKANSTCNDEEGDFDVVNNKFGILTLS